MVSRAAVSSSFIVRHGRVGSPGFFQGFRPFHGEIEHTGSISGPSKPRDDTGRKGQASWPGWNGIVFVMGMRRRREANSACSSPPGKSVRPQPCSKSVSPVKSSFSI